MKRIVIVTCVGLISTFIASAQLTPFRPKKDSVRVKVIQSPGLMSEPTRKTPLEPVITNASYLLSAVKVTIRTGSDNKESLSNVSIELGVRNASYGIFSQNSVTNELKSNSTANIGLEVSDKYISESNPNMIPVSYYTSPAGSYTIKMSDVEQYGLGLRIIYKPNFFADAWKIETVSLTLEFRDVKGNLHPSSGQKTINFSNASTFLDNFDKRILICTADKYLNPLTSFVTKDFSTRW